ncbi:MAG: hypothetical protein GC202_14305 [Alphaproteobacteria bacterium]|nr:hypothetical protein [Alphaproteobacteria bacterium]
MGIKVFNAKVDASVPVSAAAIYRRAESGDPDAPLLDPVAHLDKVEFHSSLDCMQRAAETSPTVTISHAAVSSGTTPPLGSAGQQDYENAVVVAHDVLTHGLPYVPFVLISIGGEVVPIGHPVQSTAEGIRYVQAIVDGTKVQIQELAIPNLGQTLPAIDVTYRVVCLKRATPTPVLDIKAGEGDCWFKCGAFDSTAGRYLRFKAGGESGLFLINGPSVDLDNGVARTVTPLGTVIDDFTSGNPALNYGGPFGAGSITSYGVSLADDDEYSGRTFVDINSAGQYLRAVKDGRVLLDTSRPMFNVFQTVDLTGQVFTFPSPTTDYFCDFRGSTYSDLGASYTIHCTCWTTIAAQEWSQVIDLATLDSDQADFALGLVNFTQTVAPDQLRYDSSATRRDFRKPVEGVWSPVQGSILIEQWRFIKRAISFYVEGNKLKAKLQQSVAPFNLRSTFDPSHGDGSATDTEIPARWIFQYDHDQYSVGSPVSFYYGVALAAQDANCASNAAGFDFGSEWTFDLKFVIGRISAAV